MCLTYTTFCNFYTLYVKIHLERRLLTMPQPHETWSMYYDFVYQTSFGTSYQQITENNLNWIVENVPTNSKIFDIGAGTGRLAIPLTIIGYEVTALDQSKALLQILQERANADNLQIKYINTEIENYNEEEQYDLVICLFTTMNYIVDENSLRRSIEKIINSTKNGDKILFDLAERVAFKSYSAKILQGIRRVTITPLGNDIYEYQEKTYGVMNDKNFNYSDIFNIKFWHSNFVEEIFNSFGQDDFREIPSQIYGHKNFLVIKN